MTKSFADKLNAAITHKNSLLCVGLDPEAGKFPADFLPDAPTVARVKAFCLDIIAQTADLVCCYKPNSAFFEQYGAEGWEALREVIAACHAADVLVLLDAKRGDIGSTATAYARAVFDGLDADAVTVSPYLGRDSIAPFLAYPGKAVFVLCFTSNPSAAAVQQHGAPPLFERIAGQAQTWGDNSQLGFVVGATQPEALASVRALAPDRWILAPGVGAQGGDLETALSAGLDAQGSGMIVPVSRAILYAEDPRAAALMLRDQINVARSDLTGFRKPVRSHLILALYEAGCVKFGEFTLASGKPSPIYIDLRRVISFPEVFRRVVMAYVHEVSGLTFDCIAAVPYAALPTAAAVALQLNRPLIYPRKEVKAHGTGQAVEGAFAPGQTAVAIEDVITSGGSIITAIQTMQDAGLKVQDVVVLVDREQGGQAALAEKGLRLHAVLTIGQILDTLRAEGCITAATFEAVKRYLTA
ncbi:MAG TPA: orotidine-5'-phosphate decarboxylase [Anaerolineae bacterium]|nr:orotidine-5'-phosphate decarboxylase [Anaerolineae bacterium]HQH39496.1 orotidine-5'-phosphate decarboxylase [Anaerolineae bacterium]